MVVKLNSTVAGDELAANKLTLNQEIPEDAPPWVMIARLGEWRGHPAGPEMITPAHLVAAKDAFDRNYRGHGTDIAVDWHHQSVLASTGMAPRAPAAGWIKEMELRAGEDELWGRVQPWSEEARLMITSRQYRYLSPVLRFNAADPVTGEAVLMQVHSVALTNTPFMTSLEALNDRSMIGAGTEAGAKPGTGQAPGPLEGGDESMDWINALAESLGKQPEEIASCLGLTLSEDGKAMAEALVANAARVTELEAQVAGQPIVNDAIAALLGIEKGAEEKAVKAKIMGLQLHAGTSAVRTKLGLADGADDGAVLNAIGELQTQRRASEAEALTDKAITDGKIAPAHRDALLAMATNDLAATEALVNSLPSQTDAPAHGNKPGVGGPRALTDVEAALCAQMNLTPEEFVAAG